MSTPSSNNQDVSIVLGNIFLPSFFTYLCNISQQMPSNKHNIVNGSVIVSDCPEASEQITDKQLVLTWDGRYICSGYFTWDVNQLSNEIDCGYWRILGHITDVQE